ncbi:putative ribonuclease H-like domain-containing protein [Tanacetum coccineum]
MSLKKRWPSYRIDYRSASNNGVLLIQSFLTSSDTTCRTKDETSEILCNLIIGLEKQLNHNCKIIRCDNGTEFKNYAMNEFCAKKGIKREFSVARTPQQNGVAKRKNRTLIEAARTMLADSLLPIPFWAEAVNTACYFLEDILGAVENILNTLDSLGKFDGKFDEDQPNVAGTGPNLMFDLDFLTNSMNYIPVSVENQVNIDAVEDVPPAVHEKSSESSPKDNDVQDSEDAVNKENEQDLQDELKMMKAAQATSTNQLNTVRPFVSTGRSSVSTDRSNTPNVSAASTSTGANADKSSFVYLGGKIPIDASTLPNADLPIDPNMPVGNLLILSPNDETSGKWSLYDAEMWGIC